MDNNSTNEVKIAGIDLRRLLSDGLGALRRTLLPVSRFVPPVLWWIWRGCSAVICPVSRRWYPAVLTALPILIFLHSCVLSPRASMPRHTP